MADIYTIPTYASYNQNHVSVGGWNIVVAVTYASSGSVSTITDTAGLTWYKLGAWSFAGDIEIWWAFALNAVETDTITATFSGSPTEYYILVQAFGGLDVFSPWNSNYNTVVTGALAALRQDGLYLFGEAGEYPQLGQDYISYIIETLESSLNPAPGIYGVMTATDNADTFFGTSFREITGVTGVGEIDPLTGHYMPGTGSIGTTSPGDTLPFTFAWVNADETDFTLAMARVDEDILSIDLQHEEGQVPTLEIVIKNPRVGLLSPNRKQWCWLAYQPPLGHPFDTSNFIRPGEPVPLPGGSNVVVQPVEGTPEYVVDGYVRSGYQVYDGAYTPITPTAPTTSPYLPSPTPPAVYPPDTTIIPLFFGELVGIPDDLFGEKITLKFIARPSDYIEAKQAVAETLKTPGNYDPVLISEKKRDDPDTILEGWSSLYHVDRTTLAVTASDILVGEDGMVLFPESPPSALYDSVKIKIGQAPLSNVQVEGTVHWTQRTSGYVTGPSANVSSYTGSTFAEDWPKPGKSLGAGWTVESSYVNDTYMISHTPNWHQSITTTAAQTIGSFNGPQPLPDCSVSSTSLTQDGPALLGPCIGAGGVLLDDQGVCYVKHGSGPGTPSYTVPMKIETLSVFIPLWVLNCSWTLRYNAKREYTELCTVNVTANTQAVLTSPTVEQNTAFIKVNGEVGQPVLVYDAWSDFENSYVGTGQLIYPNDPTTPGGLAYQVCVSGGLTGSVEPVFSDTPGVTVADNDATWASLGENPQNATQRMTFGTSYGVGDILVYVPQVFDPNQGTMVDVVPPVSSYYLVTEPCATNNAYTLVTYTPPITESDQLIFLQAPVTVSTEQFGPVAGMFELGNPAWLGIPVGGSAENVTARCYFPTVRGQQSIEYMINRARAKIRMRSRAIEVSWDCPFDKVVGMSCRMNATLYDPRLPGGFAVGKVTKYGMTASDGKMLGHVTIGCAAGYNTFGNTGADIAYASAPYIEFDDGLQFPLQSFAGGGGVSFGGGAVSGGGGAAGISWCDGGTFSGLTLAEQAKLLTPAAQTQVGAMIAADPQETEGEEIAGAQGQSTFVALIVTPAAAWGIAEAENVLPETMMANPIGWSCVLKPVTNGPFGGSYTITTTPLEIPMGINLEATSSE